MWNKISLATKLHFSCFFERTLNRSADSLILLITKALVAAVSWPTLTKFAAFNPFGTWSSFASFVTNAVFALIVQLLSLLTATSDVYRFNPLKEFLCQRTSIKQFGNFLHGRLSSQGAVKPLWKNIIIINSQTTINFIVCFSRQSHFIESIKTKLIIWSWKSSHDKRKLEICQLCNLRECVAGALKYLTVSINAVNDDIAGTVVVWQQDK